MAVGPNTSILRFSCAAERRFPESTASQGLPFTLAEQDQVAGRPPGGGLVRGAIRKVTGPSSSGRRGLVLAALALSTQPVELLRMSTRATAWIRAWPSRRELFWIDCCGSTAGGIDVVVFDLRGFSQRQLGDWHGRTWTRLKHARTHRHDESLDN